MRKLLFITLLCVFIAPQVQSQITVPKFGKGIKVIAEDSSFYMKIGFRFQTLYTNEWDVLGDGLSDLDNYESSLFIRRSRIKLNGWAINPNLTYKAELALSNRDNGGGNSKQFSNAANIILDAFVQYKFYKNVAIKIGQFKLPGNRERVISSGNMQFVDRSRLNSRFTLDRDVGVMLSNKHKIGSTFIIKEMFAWTSGEGKNVTSVNRGGHGYSFKIEALPFGEFRSKGDYVGSAIKKEDKPKLAVAFAYDINDKAGRNRGQKGSFLPEIAIAKTIFSYYADLMFKYKSISIMAEYAIRNTEDGDPIIYGPSNDALSTYYIGNAINLAVGYMLPKNWEIAGRYTDVKPHKDVANEEVQYTLGLSKYIRGHKLKIQSDATYRAIKDSDNELIYRVQMDIHF